jgi:uncharacterized protein YcbX
MARPEAVGVVAELWRFPVKSMAGEKVEEAFITGQGLLGDRGYALLDVEVDDLVSASNRHFPGLMNWGATFLEPPRLDSPLPAVRVTSPDGASAASDTPALPELLSSHFGRRVRLVRAMPDAYRRRQAAFFAGVGLECIAPAGSLVDLGPVSVISTATLSGLSRAGPGSRFDPRRFRMNLVMATTAEGFVENAWVGRQLELGGQVRLAVALPDPRCVMTTLAQGDLPKDPVILRTVAGLNCLPVGAGGPLPCAGVYATVVRSGLVRVGDSVLLTDG